MIGVACSLVAAVGRRNPRLRGLYRIAKFLNRVLLRYGAEPLRIAPMADATKIRVDLRSQTEFYSFYVGIYDPEWMPICNSLYDPSSVFIDVGANIGFYSVAIGQAIRAANGTGRVLAFEAHPQNSARLRENIDLNHLDSVVSCRHVALSSEKGTLTLVMREDFVLGSGTGNASVAAGAATDSGFETVEVSAERLDDLVGDLNPAETRIGFIKVDIEGHEDQFLKGARETIRRHEPILMLEVNKAQIRAAGLEVNSAMLAQLPANYRTFRKSVGRLEEITNLAACAELENVIALPESKRSMLAALR